MRLSPLFAARQQVYIIPMFSVLRNILAVEQDTRLPAPDAQLALAALLVRLARADGDYAQSEISLIDRVLAERFVLSPFEATQLRANAERLEAAAPDTVRFTRAIKEGVAYEDRLGVIEALWKVVLADGHRGHEESAILRLVADLLGINDRDSNLARKRVEDAG